MRYKFTGGVPQIIKDLKDVTIQGSEIAFGKSWTKSKIDEILTHATTGEKSKETGVISAKEMSADDKAKILTMIGGEIAKQIDKFGVYEFIASTDEVDTDRDKFEKSLLDIWAVQYANGVPFVYRHDYDSGIGQTFKASVVRNEAKQRWELIVGVYVLPTAKLETDLAVNIIDGGVFKNASIRARTGQPTYMDANDYGIWVYVGDKDAKALELSLVPHGANESATRIKEKQYQLIENMEKLTVKLKHLKDAETDITPELVKSMSEKLHTYQEKEATERQTKVDLFINKSLTIDPNTDREDLETLAKGWTDEKLTAKIQSVTEKEAAMKKGLTPENAAPETGLKAKTNFVNSFN